MLPSVSPWLSEHATRLCATLSEALEEVKRLGVGPVYLGGPIHGLSDAECVAWRDRATRELPMTAINPVLWDFRGKEEQHKGEIVWRDLAAIDRSKVLLVNASKCGWGTAMEIFYARRTRHIPVIAFLSVDGL